MWFQDNEGAKFWMQVLTDLKTRGVKDILICCVDGLKGSPKRSRRSSRHDGPDVHRAPDPQSLRYVPRRQYDQVVKDLRPIYTAVDTDAAMAALKAFEREMGRPAAGDRPGLAQQLGVHHPVPGLRARRSPRDLHDQRDRSLEPPTPQSRQDQGNFPTEDAARKLICQGPGME